MEREVRFMKEVLEGIMGKCDTLEREKKKMKTKFQEYKHTMKDNKEL